MQLQLDEFQEIWQDAFARLGTQAPDLGPLLQAWQQPQRMAWWLNQLKNHE